MKLVRAGETSKVRCLNAGVKRHRTARCPICSKVAAISTERLGSDLFNKLLGTGVAAELVEHFQECTKP